MNVRRLVRVCVACALGFAVACGRSGQSARDLPTVTVLFENDDYVFGPSRDDTPKFLVFLPLLDSESREGRLAERWEHSADYRTWTVHLRPDVRWHDGVPVTAHDVAFTLTLMQHPEVVEASPDAYTVALIDDYTVCITYRRPREELGGWQVYYPKHLLEDLDPAEFFRWEFWKQPIGNGPYRVVRRVPGTAFELEANPDFYKGKPAIDHVVLRLGGTSKVSELTSGAVDIASYLRQTDVQKLAGDPRFHIYHTFVYSEPVVIHWNHRNPFLADHRVRRALTMAIDRKELFALLGFPSDLPTFDGMGHWRRAAHQFRDGSLGQPLPHDSIAAKRLLDSAGWVDADGDGVRERDGERAEFTMLAPGGGILETLEPIVYLQDQLRRVGVRMEIQPLDRRAAQQRWRSRDFDAYMGSFRFDPADLLEGDWFGEGSPIGYENPVIVGYLRRINATADSEEQDALYRELYPIFRREVPVTFLFPWAETFAVRNRIKGIGSDHAKNPIQVLEDLWIEREP